MSYYCKVCGTKTKSYPYCQQHKWAVRRAEKRVKAESLLVDVSGGTWWIWDQLGNVFVAAAPSRPAALAELDQELEG
jgi:hypothetical protein